MLFSHTASGELSNRQIVRLKAPKTEHLGLISREKPNANPNRNELLRCSGTIIINRESLVGWWRLVCPNRSPLYTQCTNEGEKHPPWNPPFGF